VGEVHKGVAIPGFVSAAVSFAGAAMHTKCAPQSPAGGLLGSLQQHPPSRCIVVRRECPLVPYFAPRDPACGEVA
jgi:hypothetical protein